MGKDPSSAGGGDPVAVVLVGGEGVSDAVVAASTAAEVLPNRYLNSLTLRRTHNVESGDCVEATTKSSVWAPIDCETWQHFTVGAAVSQVPLQRQQALQQARGLRDKHQVKITKCP